jgi:hypothetical protein
MDAEQCARLLAVSTAGDDTVPTCASCGQKLYRKTFGDGVTAWVCHAFPACRTKIRAQAT